MAAKIFKYGTRKKLKGKSYEEVLKDHNRKYLALITGPSTIEKLRAADPEFCEFFFSPKADPGDNFITSGTHVGKTYREVTTIESFVTDFLTHPSRQDKYPGLKPYIISHVELALLPGGFLGKRMDNPIYRSMVARMEDFPIGGESYYVLPREGNDFWNTVIMVCNREINRIFAVRYYGKMNDDNYREIITSGVTSKLGVNITHVVLIDNYYGTELLRRVKSNLREHEIKIVSLSEKVFPVLEDVSDEDFEVACRRILSVRPPPYRSESPPSYSQPPSYR